MNNESDSDSRIRYEDYESQQILEDLYPEGFNKLYQSEVEGRDFMLYYVLQ